MQKSMNWGEIPFDWNRARGFLATAEEGSLSAAAEALGLAQPTLGRQVAALEEELGVALFERTGRSLILTPTGAELAEHVRAMADAAMRVALTASGQSTAIEGLVRVTASDAMAAYHLPPVLAHLQEIAPKLNVEIVASNDIRDLQQREADIAIRHVRPEQPELVAKSLGDARGRFYATPEYLDRNGRPQSFAEFAGHRMIWFGDAVEMEEHLKARGMDLSGAHFCAGSDSGLVGWNLVRAGLGIGIMSDGVGALTPEVELVYPEMEPFTFPVWLTSHREVLTSRRIRVVFDALAEKLSV